MKYIFMACIFTIVAFSFFLATHTPILHDGLFYAKLAGMISSQHALYTLEQVAVAGSHPLLVPALFSVAGRLVMPVLFIALLVYFWSITRSWWFTFLLAAMPLIFSHSFQLYADLPLAALLFVGVSQLYAYMEKRQGMALVLSAVAFGLALHAKSLALPLTLIAIAVFTVWHAFNKRNWTDWLFFVAIIGAFYLPLHLSHSTIVAHAAGLASAGISANPGYIYVNAYRGEFPYNPIYFLFSPHGFLAKLFCTADFGLLFWVIGIFTLIEWRKVLYSNIKYVMLIIVLGLGAIIYALAQPACYAYLLDSTLASRLLMSLAPVGIWYCWLLYKEEA